jgi:hypothetical protein
MLGGQADELHAVILELGETLREFRLERARETAAPQPAAKAAEATRLDVTADDAFDNPFKEPLRLALGGRAL